MSKAFGFIRKHWFTLGLLAASVVAVNWVVTHKRAPGSMTVIEAQGMDMTDMRPPSGTQPVAVDVAHARSLEDSRSFPATIIPFNEEEVVARVPGRVNTLLVYPGDEVKPGQLLATLDAPEYDAELKKAQAMAAATTSEVVSAERMVAHHRNVLAGAQAFTRVAEAAASKAQADQEAAELELKKSNDELSSKRSDQDARQAELTYAGRQIVRQQELYNEGIISLDALQKSQRDRDAAAARVQNAEASVSSGEESVQISQKQVESAHQTVVAAGAELDVAKADAAQAQEGIAQAHADASAKQFESGAADANASGASAFADYRQLRSLSGGVVSERVVSPGTAVTVGQVVLRLQSIAKVRVQADVPQTLSDVLRVGMPVKVALDSFQRSGRLTSIFPSVDPQTRTFKVEAVISNSDGSLKPGMFARLEIGGSKVDTLAVRSVAVQKDDTGTFVWVIARKQGTGTTDWTCTMHPQVSEKGPGKCPICSMDLVPRERGGSLAAHRQPVSAGKKSGDYTLIVTGLKEGDKVIWSGFENLIEGTAVMEASK